LIRQINQNLIDVDG